MRMIEDAKKTLCFLLVIVLLSLSLSACSDEKPSLTFLSKEEPAEKTDSSRYLVAVEDEPDTVDFQSTTLHYTVALNAFDRLVEMNADPDNGRITITPALAESYELSSDGRSYTFKLREDVKFSNGSPLTSSDVLYTFKRLLTYPKSCNQDIVMEIKGAEKLMKGETDQLEGFKIVDDREFVITLEQPFAAFLACITMPAASIMDEETTAAAGDKFGMDTESTVGTGPFILEEWTPGKGMKLRANPDCWQGAPDLDGLDLRFLTDSEEQKRMFENGELDFLDLDELGDLAEYFMKGSIYKDKLYKMRQIGIAYIALNASIKPLDDVRVRKAMQLALDRRAILDAIYSGRGSLENGIFPHGLIGYNADLPEIPYDPVKAKKLLSESGYPDGFDMEVTVRNSSTQLDMARMKLAISMWKEIGINAELKVIDEGEFMDLRKVGKLECYTATWIADYNDPDNFIFTFFGNDANTTNRSLCYSDEAVMERVRKARGIVDETARIKEYQDLEKTIIQDDASWVPLMSRLRYYVTGDRIENFHGAWNGSVKNVYRYMKLKND